MQLAAACRCECDPCPSPTPTLADLAAPEPCMNASTDRAKPCGNRRPPRRRRSATSLVVDDSGGIVRLFGTSAILGRGAALGLGFAALEVFPQRRREAGPTPRGRFLGLRTILHGNRIGRQTTPIKALAWPVGAGLLAHPAALWQGTRRFAGHESHLKLAARRCRSSVVEHSLGKGEVVSSILPGSTIFLQ